jgi:hypothetical protein
VQAQGREKLARCVVSAHVARFPARRQIERVTAIGESSGKHVLAVANLLPDRVGEISAVAAGHLEQLFGMGHRQRFENQGIDQAENGGIGADSQRQREDGHGGKSRTSAKGA